MTTFKCYIFWANHSKAMINTLTEGPRKVLRIPKSCISLRSIFTKLLPNENTTFQKIWKG